jgi:hypothetical protein
MLYNFLNSLFLLVWKVSVLTEYALYVSPNSSLDALFDGQSLVVLFRTLCNNSLAMVLRISSPRIATALSFVSRAS